MMQHKHVAVAAQHTFSILTWAISLKPLSTEDLHAAFEAISFDRVSGSHNTAENGSYNARKAITFDGVQLAYGHFFGKNAAMWDIRRYLMATENQNWAILHIENIRNQNSCVK